MILSTQPDIDIVGEAATRQPASANPNAAHAAAGTGPRANQPGRIARSPLAQALRDRSTSASTRSTAEPWGSRC
jgi:hypothetical protein